MYSRQKLATDFGALGIAPGDAIMMHASVRAVGAVAGGPDEIHLALKDAVTSDGTLLMYAGCPIHFDDVGRGHLSAEEEAEILEKLPAFDAKTTRANRENGALVEFFRSYPGTLASQHVTRFVAWGKEAAQLLSHTPWDYAFGHESPLDRLVALDGRILLIGSDHDAVTFLHYAEHIVDIPGKRIARFKVPVLVNGVRVWRDMLEFDSSGAGAHPNWPDRMFAKTVDTYLEASTNVGGKVGDAQCYLFRARALLDFALPLMRHIAADRSVADSLRELA